MKLDKDEFEFHVSGLFDRCMNAVENLLVEAGIAAVRLMTRCVNGLSKTLTSALRISHACLRVSWSAGFSFLIWYGAMPQSVP